ncbi:17598_t:CDS:2 [Racocetra fulgida]|uniref:Cytochrome c oxidase assembly factor 3 n=1 Tax=Racocetra fulgida TaxID=60492 RepID=A0A9N9CFU7_9GLOM|nr:17598_t:CDS:2 [Racocetra fulgida]
MAREEYSVVVEMDDEGKLHKINSNPLIILVYLLSILEQLSTESLNHCLQTNALLFKGFNDTSFFDTSTPQTAPQGGHPFWALEYYAQYFDYHQAKGYSQSPALQRARRPFFVRNVMTGLLLLGFTGAVYTYSIMAVKQDDLGDVPMPQFPADNEESTK